MVDFFTSSLHQLICIEALKPSPTNSWILLLLDRNGMYKKEEKRGKCRFDKLNSL